jgi:CheY-like chemotaxis protein
MRTLLLADESITVQRVIALTFAEQDIQVVSVPDGRQAMEKMAAQTPDIVLAGTSLPQLSGYDLAQLMRSKPDLKDVPVLLLSGAFELVDDARLMASGANGVLEKPVEPTVVIGRVKELLGLKSDDKPAMAPGRTITPAVTSSDKKLPAPMPPPAAPPAKAGPSNWEQLREQTGLDRHTRPVEDTATRGDYLDTLDAAFDTLDQHLSGRSPAAKAPRNPAGPLGQAGAVEPRSTDPRSGGGLPTPGKPVYEVDDDWFADKDSAVRADATADRAMTSDLRDPAVVPAPAPTPDAPVFEVDQEWFKGDEKVRAAKAAAHQQLAAEMGVHDVDFAEAKRPAPSSDFEFGLDDLKAIEPRTDTAPQRETAATVAEPATPEPAPQTVIAPALVATAPLTPAPAPEITVVTPEITEQMLDQIAARVADRLTAGAFGEGLRDALTATMRDTVNQAVAATVRPVVSETSERVVREAVTQTLEGVVREVVAQTAERAVREVVAQTTERVVREVVPETAQRAVREVVPEVTERAVREVVAQTAERAAPDAASQATERVVREVVPETAERVVREVVAQTADRAVRDVVSETAERLVRDEIERIKAKRQA